MTDADGDAVMARDAPTRLAPMFAAPPKKTAGSDAFATPFVEKYRPQLISDVVGNPAAVARLKAIAQEGNMLNVIITGPPGTGKTTSIMCLARAILGPNYREAVLELNASDDRGVDIVRNKIKMFAQKKVTLPEGAHKIVILDEADSMTAGAQQALRRTMELYASTTRFAFACNISSKIIEPIQSRCAIIRFTRLSDEQVLERVMHVVEQEHITYAKDGLEALVFTADGDMRQAMNNLQSTWAGFGHVNAENVFKVCDQPHPLVVRELIRSCAAKDLDNALLHLNTLWRQGYAASDIITTVFRVLKSFQLEDSVKLALLKQVAVTHMRIVNGEATLVQLTGLLARMVSAA